MRTATYDISDYKPLRPGTRVAIGVWDFSARCWNYSDTAVVKRWTKVMGPRDGLPAGYEPVLFDDSVTGNGLMVHRDQMRIIDNRPGFAAA